MTGDDLGSYELLLHCLLFNLRMQARRLASEVQFTIGNHDAGTVTGYKEKGSRISAWQYVEQKHWTFAPSCRSVGIAKTYRGDPMFWRRDMLLPFYACSPYIMLTFGKVAFVHGGFVWGDVRLGEEPNNAKNNTQHSALCRTFSSSMPPKRRRSSRGKSCAPPPSVFDGARPYTSLFIDA